MVVNKLFCRRVIQTASGSGSTDTCEIIIVFIYKFGLHSCHEFIRGAHLLKIGVSIILIPSGISSYVACIVTPIIDLARFHIQIRSAITSILKF